MHTLIQRDGLDRDGPKDTASWIGNISFLYSLSLWLAANGLLTLLPLYARTLGASSAEVGRYMASAYGALFIGSVVAGKTATPAGTRAVLMCLASTCIMPAIMWGSNARSLVELTASTSVAWGLLGFSLANLQIYVALYAPERARPSIFACVAVSAALGTGIGSVIIGASVDHWGYSRVLAVDSLVYLAAGATVLLLRLPRSVSDFQLHLAEVADAKRSPWYFLPHCVRPALSGNLLINFVTFCSRVGVPMLMSKRGYGTAAIGATIGAGALMAIPVTALLARCVSVRQRRTLLGGTIVFLCFAVALLGVAQNGVQLQVGGFLISAFTYGCRGLRTTCIADVTPQEFRSVTMSMYDACTWLAGILGFAVIGYALDAFGGATFLVIASLAGLALPLIAGNPGLGQEKNLRSL